MSRCEDKKERSGAGAVLLSIDPGLSRTGFALWDVSGMPVSTRRLASKELLGDRLMDVWDLKTDPANELDVRLRVYGSHVAGIVSANNCPGTCCLAPVVAIERPAAGGTAYTRNRKKGFGGNAVVMGTMAVSQVVGVIFGAAVASGANVRTLVADRKSKDRRWEDTVLYVEDKLVELGKRRTNKETRDALWMGVRVLTDARIVW